MEYRLLGGSGFKVPVLSLGTGTFGGGNEFFKAWGGSQVAEASRLVDICLDAGLTMFDSADIYPMGGEVGSTEEIVGRWLRGKRDQIILATKAGGPMGPALWQKGGSRKHLLDAIDGSLRGAARAGGGSGATDGAPTRGSGVSPAGRRSAASSRCAISARFWSAEDAAGADGGSGGTTYDGVGEPASAFCRRGADPLPAAGDETACSRQRHGRDGGPRRLRGRLLPLHRQVGWRCRPRVGGGWPPEWS